MNDGVDAIEIDLVDIPDIALHDFKIGMRAQFIAEPHDVESPYAMSSLKELRNQYAALITTCASDKEMHDIFLYPLIICVQAPDRPARTSMRETGSLSIAWAQVRGRHKRAFLARKNRYLRHASDFE
jgi:hypothetical protein